MNGEKIFFFHLPKAGGTSIVSVLSAFPDRSISPVVENNTFDHHSLDGRYDRFKGYDIYAGHYGRDVYDAVADKHRIITNFRHPVNRVASIYEYFRYTVKMDQGTLELPQNRAVWAAKNLSFDEFISSREENILIYINDFHFRQLCQSPWELRCDVPEGVAKDMINEMACVFICEYPDQSNALFNEAFGAADIPRLNVMSSADRENLITAQSSRKILSLNERDVSIYDFALSRFLPSV